MFARSGDVEALILFRIAGGKLPILPESVRAGRAVGIDWERLLALAALDNSVLVVSRALRALPTGALPATIADQFGRLAKVWEFRLTMLEQRLAEALEVLRHARVTPVLLKGSALAVTTYDGFSDRPMADVDLLVEPARAEEAHALLQRCGWRWDQHEYPAHAYVGHHHLVPLNDTRGSGLQIEIHTEPLTEGHPFELSAKDLRASATTATFAGASVRVPEPHLHAVHSMVHLSWSHGLESGAWNTIRDLSTLVDRGVVSWPTLVETAKRCKAETCCYWTLRLARRLAGVGVPDETLEALRPPIRESVRRRLESHFVHLVLRDDRACPSVAMRRRMWMMAMQPAGGVRPEQRDWRRTPRLAPEGAAHRAFGVVQRVTRHALHAPRWTKYMASLVFPSFSLWA